MPLTGTKRQNGPSQVSDDSIFEILPYLSCIIDKSTTRVVRANRLFNEKVGKGFLSSLFFADDLINKDDRRHFIESLGENTTVKNLKTLNFIGADDFPVHVAHDWKVTPIPGVDQVLLMGSQCVEKDDVCLTDALSDQEELIDFLQNAPIAMHWLSGNGTILWANNTELKALGYTKGGICLHLSSFIYWYIHKMLNLCLVILYCSILYRHIDTLYLNTPYS